MREVLVADFFRIEDSRTKTNGLKVVGLLATEPLGLRLFERVLLLELVEHAKQIFFERSLVLFWRKELHAHIFKLPATVCIGLCTLDVFSIFEQLVRVDPRQVFLLFAVAAHGERLLDQTPV